ncbi:MAG TPA: SAM-dependent methyltransferase [Stackebrandtia sp.]|jgi:O-methyltransferase involved in polyketide biosynthesis|uniref:SAM-dependent methyltransferase n=1 Tax=Stackebrandtia sp. TaxID=2023065 RepID=UPI002D42CDC1|nr:SAM-dependent methyltransferase [Stackebrandtia sp.]HZE38652.1 SAM-dependent methyltransferase [Stackebrandtia sp.]
MTDETAPPGVDTSKASVARAYNYALGGKDNFAVDRAFADMVLERTPDVFDSVRMIREFGARVAAYLAENGVHQIIDLGSGLPTTPPSIHETARAILPDTRVVYVDNDPVVAAHSRALRSIGHGLATIEADMMNPDVVFGAPELTETIDMSRPVGVLIMSVLQNMTDQAEVLRVLGDIRDRLAPGSYLAVAHLWDGSTPVSMAGVHESAAEKGYPEVLFRSRAQIAELFDGFELVDPDSPHSPDDPAIVQIGDWWPDPNSADEPDVELKLLGAVGRKP